MARQTLKWRWPDQTKPPSFDEYSTWLGAIHGVDVTREKAKYETAAVKAVQVASTSEFWTTFLSQKQEISDSYLGRTGYPLFAFSDVPPPEAKSWTSFLLKSFRRNVLDNNNWPQKPAKGWLLPDNWMTDVSDIVRTMVVVKYLDGVQYLAESLEGVAALARTSFRSDLEARETGYYAAHTHVSLTVDLPDDSWTYQRTDMEMEIQVTTQLQEVIGRLTHQQYEKRRVQPAAASEGWQWDHKSEAFQPNYLGHLLHYAEGMIMEVRERGDAL